MSRFDATLNVLKTVQNPKNIRNSVLLLKYSVVKSQLDVLFNRVLAKEEYQLIAELWFYSMCIVQDIQNLDNRFKEKIKDSKNHLSKIIKHLETKIWEEEKLIRQLNFTDRLPFLDLEKYPEIYRRDLEKLEWFKKIHKDLRQDKARKLNVDKLKSKTYFSVLFCAETLGLSPPKSNPTRNGLLDFLEIVRKFEHQKDTGDIRNILSQTYQQYTAYKNLPEIKSLTTVLFRILRENKGCYTTLRVVNEKFKSILEWHCKY